MKKCSNFEVIWDLEREFKGDFKNVKEKLLKIDPMGKVKNCCCDEGKAWAVGK